MSLLLVLAALVGAGCGGKSDRQLVQDKIGQFATAMGGRQYQTLCDQVFAPALVARLGSLGLPCELQLRQSLAPVVHPTVRIKRVVVHGKSAVANVVSGAQGQPASADVIGLVKTKAGWRISSRSTPAKGR
ncbi:MAG: nuclear transport factor 2 family protein [Solirubrobacterales bacterium]|nr:nuclear transport factor 2 family protein [Solirubrobacterales bacterium]